MVSIHIRKLKTSQRHHIKTHSKIEATNDQNQTIVMLLKTHALQANINEVELWKNGFKPHKSEVDDILNSIYKSLKHHE